MTELDDLKAALHDPPGFAPRTLDLDAVMRTGGRIRRRRRLSVGAGTGLAVLALLVGGAAVAQRVGPPGPGTNPAAVQPANVPTVVRTGLTADGGEWVLYERPVADMPQTTFGVMLGVRRDGADPVDAVMANETDGPDTAPGFHAVQGGARIEQGDSPTFGYYAGPAAKITGKVGGRTVTAAQTPLRDGIQVFWFDAMTVTGLTAFDEDGERLPTGNNTPAVG